MKVLSLVWLLLISCQGKSQQTENREIKVYQEPVKVSVPEGKELATFAGGCFWCTEAIFQEIKGVEKVLSGYTGGVLKNPTYQEVCSGATGHAEAIQITFDPQEVAYEDLLEIFFGTHDPTTLNRQGADAGTQYRSAVFYHSKEQKEKAEKYMDLITREKLYDSPVVTQLEAATVFYEAEPYHQDYYQLNSSQGYCRAVIAPKLYKLRKFYASKLK